MAGKRNEDDSYRIAINGSWTLKDLSDMPRAFAQVYAFQAAFLLADEARDPERLANAFVSYPWQGGYSAVGFYNTLFGQLPYKTRPRIKSIRYSSPGFIELGLIVGAATAVGRVVKVFVDSAGGINKLYGDIYKGLHERKLLRIEAERQSMQLAKEQVDFVVQSTQQIAKGLGFQSLEEMNAMTDHPLTTLKILLSYYRRVRTLAEYTIKGKAEFPSDEPPKWLDS